MPTSFNSTATQDSYSSIYTRHYQPRHLLALQIIQQIHKLELRPQHITQKMGYLPKHTLPACERLRHVLSNQYLGLDGSYIDGRFTAQKFLTKLLSVVEIAYETVEDDLAHIQYQISIDADNRTNTESLQNKRSRLEIEADYS
ncbi:hypothetical protein ACS8E3_03045 [Psychrobacter sp. 2Y5]|uniref:hypothetical protein n=1 Tax=unclassified Psychrobacter TaxID=196806 RepID=UPI003F463BA1